MAHSCSSSTYRTPCSVLSYHPHLTPDSALQSVHSPLPNLLEFDYDQEVALYPLDVHSDLLLLHLPPSLPLPPPRSGEKEMDVDRLLEVHVMPPTTGTTTTTAEHRVLYVFQLWRRAFGLSCAGTSTCIFLALHLLRRLLRAVSPFVSADTKVTRLSLAVCFWLAVKLDGLQRQVPALEDLQDYTTVQQDLILEGEARLCKLLQWKLLDGWAYS